MPHPRQEDGHSCGVHVLMVGLCFFTSFFLFHFLKVDLVLLMHYVKVFKGEMKCNFRFFNFRGYFMMSAKFFCTKKNFPSSFSLCKKK